MSHPYDASTKYLIQARLADWLPLAGRTTTAELQVIDADLATVTASADRVLRVCEAKPWLLHLELQASRDPDLLPNLPVYNVLARRRHGIPVKTVLVLLRKSADWSGLTGTIEEGIAGEPAYLVFRYGIVRVWQLPAETFLGGGLGILPLAPLSDVTEAELPGIIRQMDSRIRQEATRDEAGTLWTAADVLMGLRYPRPMIAELLRGVHGMKESVTYQAIVEEGRLEGMPCARQDDLLRLGRRQYGAPNPEAISAIRNIADDERLARMVDVVLDKSTWDELLATP